MDAKLLGVRLRHATTKIASVHQTSRRALCKALATCAAPVCHTVCQNILRHCRSAALNSSPFNAPIWCRRARRSRSSIVLWGGALGCAGAAAAVMVPACCKYHRAAQWPQCAKSMRRSSRGIGKWKVKVVKRSAIIWLYLAHTGPGCFLLMGKSSAARPV